MSHTAICFLHINTLAALTAAKRLHLPHGLFNLTYAIGEVRLFGNGGRRL
jgi:hypothetical protein